MPLSKVSRFLLWNELKFIKWHKSKLNESTCWANKKSEFEVCPRCATKSDSIYDHRIVKIKDVPIRRTQVVLQIRKRRFYCKTCRKPFTEPIAGIKKGHRTTQRFAREVRWACENFSSLSRVRRAFRCSSGFVYTTFYRELKTEVKRNINYPWPTTIGIDEHFFSRAGGIRQFATVFADFNNKRLRQVCLGKVRGELIEQIKHIEGRENVKHVVLDLSDSYKSFAKEYFPNAQLVADKFHVLRLLSPAINKRRTAITGDRRTNPIRRLLLVNRKKLDYFKRVVLDQWLDQYPEIKEVYHFKEALHGFYRIRGFNRAARALTAITDRMALSQLPEIIKLRKTLMRWRNEILAYFPTLLTNARTEGFNSVAKLVQKQASGYKNFENYRLRLLNACAY